VAGDKLGTRFGDKVWGQVHLVPAAPATRVLATAWWEGRPFDRFVLQARQQERDAAGRALYEFYLGTLYRHGLFNADPHPGNLLFPETGGTVILDHGCVRRFDSATIESLLELARAVREDDAPATRHAIARLGGREPSAGPAFEETRRLLRGFFSPTLVPGRRRLQRASASRRSRCSGTSVRSCGCSSRAGYYSCSGSGSASTPSWHGLAAELDWQKLEAEMSAAPFSAPGGGGTARPNQK
jgi:hypothetical protein